MFFRMIYDEKLAQAAYLIGCQKTGEAIVIDPQRDIDQYLRVAEAEDLRITAATETHIHADFLSGVRQMAEETGCKVLLSDEGDKDWKYAWPTGKKSDGTSYDYQPLKDGDIFKIGNIAFKILHTPGHTPEHISFLVTDHGGGAAEPMGIASGDFVFVGDVGRPDLLETAAGVKGAQEASAKTLFQSIQRFKDLPDYLQLWPGHGSGSACGKALGAVPQSTVGYEKRFNSAVNFRDGEQGFIKEITTGQPSPPYYFGRMKVENKSGPAVLEGLPAPEAASVDAVLAALAKGAVLLDARDFDAYAEGHLPGAIFAPFGKPFPTVAGSYVEADQQIYLLLEHNQVDSAVRDLIHVGLDNVAGYITPAALMAYAADGGRLETTGRKQIETLMSCPTSEPFLVLDVRRPDEFDEGHLAGTLNISHTRLIEHLDKLPKDRPLWVHCRTGVRSSYAVGFLQSRGYDAVQLDGGYVAWEEAGGIVVE